MKSTYYIAVTMFLIAACDSPTPGTSAPTDPATAESRDAADATSTRDTDVYRAAVAHADRTAADIERDAGRQPAAVLEFFGIAPGMHVLDLYSGGGYYAELLARVVGATGSVTAHNNDAYLGFAGTEIDARYADGRLPNVAMLMAENNELDLEADRYDAITMILTFHDIYYADPDNGWPEIDGGKLLGELFTALKPGGIVGLVDHYAAEGAPADTGGTTHRIDVGIAIRDMQAAGFVLDEASDLLRNPDDNYETMVFDPSVRGQTDRFVLRFRKPAG